METADGTGKSKRFTTLDFSNLHKKRTENERITPENGMIFAITKLLDDYSPTVC
ncbi:MAG: hypothetical protein ACLTG0_08315 [Oscillibacter sp.]